MTTQNTTSRMIPAITVPEGAGVTVERSIGSPSLRNYDPFMLLDHFSSDNPNDYIAGFPDHPHRGFSTFTYMIDGFIEHKDSMGNTGNLGPGSAQLMKAASGIIHSEMPKQENGLMRGFQLWINLPAKHKMDTPEYQEYAADEFPIVTGNGYQAKVLIGTFQNVPAPITDDITEVCYIDVHLDANQPFSYAIPTGHNCFLYVFEGDGKLGGRAVPRNTMLIPGRQESRIVLTAGMQGARFIIASGKPINESVAQYGPFVMSNREEIDQAIQDFQSNNFVRDRAWVNRS